MSKLVSPVLALAAGLSLAAVAGVTQDRAVRDAPPAEPARSAPAGSTGPYQIRCWQEGRLLFEENRVWLPAGNGRYAIRLTGTDAHGHPVMLADTLNATCLIQQAATEPRRLP